MHNVYVNLDVGVCLTEVSLDIILALAHSPSLFRSSRQYPSDPTTNSWCTSCWSQTLSLHPEDSLILDILFRVWSRCKTFLHFSMVPNALAHYEGAKRETELFETLLSIVLTILILWRPWTFVFCPVPNFLRGFMMLFYLKKFMMLFLLAVKSLGPCSTNPLCICRNTR
jgi:hypothetical protein